MPTTPWRSALSAGGNAHGVGAGSMGTGNFLPSGSAGGVGPGARLARLRAGGGWAGGRSRDHVAGRSAPVVVEALTGLAAEVAGPDEAPQGRRRRGVGVGGLGSQGVEAGDGRV